MSDEMWYGDPDYMDDFADEYSCDNCGPWCNHWGGDGLCMLAIEEMARQAEHYVKHHVRKNYCPVCGEYLTEYDIHGDEPFTFSPVKYDPLIMVFDVMGPMWLDKGVIHSKDNIHHVYVEWGNGRKESIFRYLDPRSDDNGIDRTIDLSEKTQPDAINSLFSKEEKEVEQ